MPHVKHMDIRYKYVNDYVEDGIVKIVFVKSSDKDSDILIKNLSTELYEKYSKKIMGRRL